MAHKEQVIQALRATLISVKGALTIKQCNRDYRELQGEWIPYKKLGYSTLDKLFLDVPGFKVTQNNGEWYVDAIASQETQHIVSMVSRQKPSKKGTPRLNHLNRVPKKQGSWRKPVSNNSFNYGSQYSKQYYRADGGAPYNNNYKNIQCNNKTNETRNITPTLKQTLKPQTTDNYPEKVTSKISNTLRTKDTNTFTEEYKQPTDTSTNSEVKPNRKVSASQRLSILRDRLNTVDVIPLQFPAVHNECLENRDPIMNVVPEPNLEPAPINATSVEKLEWICKKLGLPQPVYKALDMRPKRGSVTYDCTVKVGATYSACSYPDSSPTEELAKEVAAVKLLSIIESSEAKGMPTSTMSKAISWLVDLMSDHEAGVWAIKVPHLYREKYGESLPGNWEELVEHCPLIKKDRVVNGLVLLPTKEEPLTPVSIESTHLDDTIDSDLPGLLFPDEDFWNVFVTVANSTLEIWVRIIGAEYSDIFEVLLADMAKYYNSSGTSVDRAMIIKNAWYAVNMDDGGWQRAKILEINEDTLTVFLGDHGDDDTVPLDKIKILEPQFRRLAAQAILCRLEGAEELAASSVGADLVRRRLPGEVLVAAPGPRTDPSDRSVALVLYDTSTLRDLNLNKEIVHDFCISGAFTVTQKPYEVEVGCVTEEGRVWVSRAGGAEIVRTALALLTAGEYRRPLPAAPQAPAPNAGTLYIVRTLAGDWVRCTIISGLDGEGTVRTQLVDSGLILRAPLSSLVPLQAFSTALNAYPHQAIQVRLGPAERAASGMVQRLRELLLGARVLCRALPAQSSPSQPNNSLQQNPPPHVELFVRTGPQNILASVNNAILMEYEYLQHDKLKEDQKETTDHLEALNRKKERIFRTSSSGAAVPSDERGINLPLPVLPALGHCFDVYIAMAANPWNFVIQPNSSRHTLQTMMSSLQTECPKISEAEAPTNPANGELYTALYEKDESWYRVTIAGAVSFEMVSVYFCDYGDLALFTTKALRPIPPGCPLARTLPPQAIKARLHDVWPLHQDWTVEDCIRFQELCVEQQFVGICKEVGKDPLNANEPLITLELIDTSTADDIYINQQLISEGRARCAAT